MDVPTIDQQAQKIMIDTFEKLEEHLQSDVFVFYGSFFAGAEQYVKQIIETLINSKKYTSTSLYVILTTTGGSLNPVKRIVDIFRRHYEEVFFIIPDYAYSAGTILCASGDKIFMSYFSALGPIDPQVMTKDFKSVSALGYLDKIEEMIEKAKKGELTDAEFLILKDFDLAELREYEQAKELANDLLKTWLPKYKFKDWETHSDGRPVTDSDKVERAEEIAQNLGDNKRWKSHARAINIHELRDLKLLIDDLEDDEKLYKLVSEYHMLMLDYTTKYNIKEFVQTRGFI